MDQNKLCILIFEFISNDNKNDDNDNKALQLTPKTLGSALNSLACSDISFPSLLTS